jgi:GT2 family glycosyltransferase
MQLSIIIVNFNTPQLTLNCLASIRKHCAAIAPEVILIDNCSQEDHRQDFISCIDDLVYIRSHENLGFGRANNLGIEVAKGKYLLLLNSDTLITDNSIERCLQFMEADTEEKTGLLGCRLLNEDLSYQSSFYPFRNNSVFNYFIANNPLLYKLFGVQKKYNPPTQPTRVGDVSGAFMLLRRTVVDKVGAFDPDFFLFFEETEWCRNRIGRHYDIVYYPDASVIHLGGKSAPREMMQLQAAVSEALFWYKCGKLQWLLFILFNMLNGFFYCLQYPFTNRQNKEAIRKYLKQLDKALPYWFIKVPAYSRAKGARPLPLVYNDARTFFFGTGKDKSRSKTDIQVSYHSLQSPAHSTAV